jgi:hypothetical protein
MILRQPAARHALAACWSLLIALGAGASARAAPSPVRVELLDRTTGTILEQHRHRWQRYVVGEPGHEYSIRVHNVSNERVLAVVSVDGVNVITGETAAPSQSGYVVNAGGSVEIAGWRKDYERTAAFYFTDVGDAYASRTGRPDNLGVIGVAAFREAVPAVALSTPVPETDARRAAQDSPASAPATAANGQASSESAGRAEAGPLGTGHGRREYSPARQVEFARRSETPDEVIAVRYDSRQRLVARGVLPRPRTGWENPDPFPALAGFVSDP